MSSKVEKRVLKNGMVILGEHMDQVESAAFSFLLPCGESLLPEGVCGAGEVISDWLVRGAGDMDSRQLSDALEGLGLHHSEHVSSSHLTLGGVLESSNLIEALRLYGDIILNPKLDGEQFEMSKQLAMAHLAGLDDDPRQKVMLAVRERFYPYPLGRPAIGKEDELKALTADQARKIAQERVTPAGTIFAVAGKFDFAQLCSEMEALFSIDKPEPPTQANPGEKGPKYEHIEYPGAQVHLGMMTPAVTVDHEDYYKTLLMVSVLSGGMSSRLFTEVREKRGLCYAVGARYHALKGHAGVNCYAGTTPDKAQETLDVIKEEFAKLENGIDDEELASAKAGLKSSLVMQGESTSSRAGGVASDYYFLRRVREIEEIKAGIENITKAELETFLKENAFEDFTIVTIGSKELQV
ncbi:Peptidase M16 inactive domain protein [Anaerohalosphaera lusitana]|uniref:Peptidase M16 inactive domain protein n=1 Tax=Anaerohalosphaera lusitana TaxID=1936003 RepID=A0A1U9NN62_9BACT|nr:pitrilysin family protein [Anaerohalosphaera lusitana]AQT68956.1 Peptidase M16 inactive domain protein [Anaerohalosphaera lusitana]